MRRTLLTFSTLIFISSLTYAQDYQDPDSIAVKKEIVLEKNLGEITLYDYGQTEMKMKFFKYELAVGNYYGSRISLSTPSSMYDIYKDPETTIQLTLEQTERFINRLYYLLQIDSIKDVTLNTSVQLNSGKTLKPGTSIWRNKKQYFFTVSNNHGGMINFVLEASDEEDIDESEIQGFLLTKDSEYNYFTVNNYDEYRDRVNKGVKNFRSLLRSVKNDKDTITDRNEAGVRGQMIDYEPLLQKGYKILKSDVHKTNDVNILADLTLERTPRKIEITDYEGQFDNYQIVTDEQFTLYAKEELSYQVFIGELLQLLDEYDAKGILDPTIVKQDNSIRATFSLFR